MSHIDFLEELNALISEVAILKTTVTEEELKTDVLEIVHETRLKLKQLCEKQELAEHAA